MAPMLKNPKNECAYGGNYHGCSCCNSKQTRRSAKKSAKRREERAWRRDQQDPRA